jgi:hypothetical protein
LTEQIGVYAMTLSMIPLSSMNSTSHSCAALQNLSKRPRWTLSTQAVKTVEHALEGRMLTAGICVVEVIVVTHEDALIVDRCADASLRDWRPSDGSLSKTAEVRPDRRRVS